MNVGLGQEVGVWEGVQGVGGGAVCRKGLGKGLGWRRGAGCRRGIRAGVGVQMGCGVRAPAWPRLPGAASGWQRLAPRPCGPWGRAEGSALCPHLWVPHPKLPLAGNREPRPMGASGVEPTYEGSALSSLPLLPSPRATGTSCWLVPGVARGTQCHGGDNPAGCIQSHEGLDPCHTLTHCVLFPKHEEEFWQYNSFQYWRAPLPAIDLSVILDLDGENMTDARTTSRTEIIETEMET
uniref:Uncharacterized protein n=1 Tax=Chrysemys picta bellii TaxID=8478 RepID=A0A8C3PAG1_CHRPI